MSFASPSVVRKAAKCRPTRCTLSTSGHGLGPVLRRPPGLRPLPGRAERLLGLGEGGWFSRASGGKGACWPDRRVTWGKNRNTTEVVPAECHVLPYGLKQEDASFFYCICATPSHVSSKTVSNHVPRSVCPLVLATALFHQPPSSLFTLTVRICFEGLCCRLPGAEAVQCQAWDLSPGTMFVIWGVGQN